MPTSTGGDVVSTSSGGPTVPISTVGPAVPTSSGGPPVPTSSGGPAVPTSSGGRRRSSGGTGHGDGGQDQYGLSQLFQPDNAPRVVIATPIVGMATSTVGVAVPPDLDTPKEDMGVVKTEGNTFRTKFKVWTSAASIFVVYG